MSGATPCRQAARALRRLLLPSFDLMLLQRRRLVRFADPGTAVLDAGCGDGSMAWQLHRLGCRVVGVSHDADAIARLRTLCAERAVAPDELDFRVHDLTRGPVAGGPFDAAVCFDVLEHIVDDRGALAAVAASLRPGGRLLVTVPDSAAPPLWGDTLSATEDGGHVRRGYRRAELASLLAEAGLRPVRWMGFGGFFAQKGTNVSRRLERRRGAVALVLRFLWLVAMRPLCRLDPLLPWPPCGLFVLAQKQ